MLLKWLAAIACAKIFWLILFTVLRSNEWTESTVVGHIGLYPRESWGYYRPLENLLSHGHYTSVCRMPGLLPFYVPLRCLFDEVVSKQCMILVQLVADILATFAIGILAARIFQSLRALHLTYALACFSTFTAVRNNFLLSDSLCVSSVVLAAFSFSNFIISNRTRSIVFTGVALCVALFLRPAMIVLVPGFIFLLVLSNGFVKRTPAAIALLALPSVVALSAWTLHNRMTDGRTIVLIAPLHECQPQMTPEFMAIRRWIMASGGDYQPWAAGGESHWFFDSPDYRPMPFQPDDFAPEYDSTALFSMKRDYHLLHSGTLASADSLQLEQQIVERANACYTAYVKHHPVRFYFLNRLVFLKMILFPKRIDDLPFPAFHEMNAAQKLIKVASWLALPMLSIASLMAIFYWTLKRRWSYLLWMCIPMGMVCMHASIGFVEQRYLATSYPFFIMLSAGLLSHTIIGKSESSATSG